MRRIAGVLRHPRSTMAALAAAPTWLFAWALLLVVWLLLIALTVIPLMETFKRLWR